MKRLTNVLEVTILLVVLCFTVGYAAFVDTLSITGTVAHIWSDANTRVTSVTTNSASVSKIDFETNKITLGVNIPNGGSVTLTTTITTLGNVPMALSGLSVTNNGSAINNVSITPNLTNTFIEICDNNDQCTGNKSKEVTITITNNTGSAINSQNLAVNLTYTPFYSVTYNGDVIGDNVLSGGTFTYTFDSNAPSSVTVTSGTSGTPSMSGSTLTITNVTSNLVLTGSSGSSGSGTPSDPYIDNSTQTYDPSTIDPGTSVILTAVEGQPQVTVDNSGDVTSFEFKSTTPTTIGDDDNGVDTGFIPFASGKNWELRLRAAFPASTNKDRNAVILDIRDNTNNTTDAHYIQVGYVGKATPPKFSAVFKDGSNKRKSIQSSVTLASNDVINITITYNNNVLTVTNHTTNTNVVNNQTANFTLANMTVLLGYALKADGTVNTNRKAQATVYEFYVKEI